MHALWGCLQTEEAVDALDEAIDEVTLALFKLRSAHAGSPDAFAWRALLVGCGFRLVWDEAEKQRGPCHTRRAFAKTIIFEKILGRLGHQKQVQNHH